MPCYLYGTNQGSSTQAVGNAGKLGIPSLCPSIAVNSLSGIYAHKVPPAGQRTVRDGITEWLNDSLPHQMLKNYHVFICSLGNIDNSHADNSQWADLYYPLPSGDSSISQAGSGKQ
jgi:hypothetical protein